MRRRVLRAHRPGPGEPLRAGRGAVLTWEPRPTEWPGWLWVTAADGRTGWAPASWLELVGDRCRLTRDYDATELSVDPGDRFSVELEESGWAWGEGASGARGWVPLSCLAPG